VEELYSAAAVGVPIEILARSICMLRPGVEGLSETIRVRSIVGRFLEHSRIYSFEAGDTASVYFGSADLMPRNLDRRIEVVAPVEGARARAEVNAILDSAFSDTTNAWELGQDGVWTRVAGKDKNGHSHQTAMMRRAQLRARRARS